MQKVPLGLCISSLGIWTRRHIELTQGEVLFSIYMSAQYQNSWLQRL
jgi:hypothetical protein